MVTHGFVHHADRHRSGGHIRFVTRGLTWPVACWTFVLLAIGVVQIVRVQWFDAAVFFAAGVGVVADGLRARTAETGNAGRRRTGGRPVAGRRSRTAATGGDSPPLRHGSPTDAPSVGLIWLSLVAGVGGAVMCLAPRHGVVMKVVVIAVGVAATGLAWRGRAVAHPDAHTRLSRGVVRLALAWALIVIAGCVWELAQFILGLVDPRATWFALSDLLNPAVATVPGRIVFTVAWLALGVWLVRRGGRR